MSLYKLIVVDDESFIIDAIDEIIDFEKLGFKLVGKFTSGKKAIEYMRNNEIDAIITDIRMSQCSGLDIVRFIKDNNLDIEIIFLTAYSLFEYAHFGIKNNIFDYILKPIEVDAIEKTLTYLNMFLTDKKKLSTFNDFGFANIVPPQLHKIISDYFSNNNPGAIQSLAAAIYNYDSSIDLSKSCFAIMNVQFVDLDSYLENQWHYGIDSLMQAIKYMLCSDKIFTCPFYTNFDTMHILLIVKNSVDNEELNKLITTHKNQFAYDSLDILNLNLNVSVGNIFFDISELHTYYQLANNINTNISQVFHDISAGKYQQASSKICSIIDYLKDDDNYFYHLTNTFIRYASYLCDLFSIDSEHIPVQFHEFISAKKETSEFAKKITKEDIIEFVQSLSGHFAQNKNTRSVSTIISYVNQHYTEDISLTEISKLFFYTSDHLGRMLKKELGITFVDYLNNLRLSHAADLLVNTEENIDQIAKESGYQNFNYFYKKFKQRYSCTPNVYRNNNKVVKF